MGIGLTSAYVRWGPTDVALVVSYIVWAVTLIMVALPGVVCWLISEVAMVCNVVGAVARRRIDPLPSMVPAKWYR